MIEPAQQEVMLLEFKREAGIYQGLAATSAALLERMLHDSGMQLHSITHRGKSIESLSDKLAKPEKEYRKLSEITDLAGVGVTTYFAEDVDRVAELIEREFLIDTANSIDKRQIIDPDRFGYQSLHYVVSVTPERCRLVEYSRFSELRLEIQVRSILQHAWAEIEHDLGYKSAAGVPRAIRRRFSRVSGLLELADDEFSAIRRELDAYAETMPQDIRQQPENVGIDIISLQSLISSEGSSVRRLSKMVAQASVSNLLPMKGATLLDNMVVGLGFLNISSIADLEKIADSHLPIVEKFAQHWMGGERHQVLHEGVGLLYLAYVLLAEQHEFSRIRSFVENFRLYGDSNELANRILATYQMAVQPD